MRSRLRPPGWAMLAVLGATLFAVGSSRDARAADPSFPVELNAAGDFDISGDLVSWQNALLGADQPTDVQFFQRGSTEARRQLLAGSQDFAVSGTPFTTAELAGRAANAPTIIEAPISVASLSAIFTTPTLYGWRTAEVDPTCDIDDPDEDPERCITRGVYTDPIRIPPESLSAMITGLTPSYQSNNLTVWGGSELAAALASTTLEIQGRPGLRHTWVNRSEGAAANKYLMEYARTLGPTAWNLRKEENPQFAWEPIGEQFSPRTQSRNGGDTQVGVIAIASVDAASDGTPDSWTGNAGAVPTTLMPRILGDYPLAGFRVAEIQNKHGDWVLPTRETIEAALAAGTTPNIAATTDVPGAYPIVYINRLYTVAGTLSVDEANSLAAMIRYIVTDGQQSVITNGGAPLTAALRSEALEAANDVIVANCTAAGFEVTSSGPSDFEPGTSGVTAIGQMKHCTAIPPPPATTSTTTTTTTTTTVASTTTVAETPISAVDVPTTPAPTPLPTTPSPAAPVPTSPRASPIVVVPTEAAPVIDATTSAAPVETDPPPETTTATTAAPSTDPAPAANVSGGGAGTRPRGVSLSALPMATPDDGSGGYKQLGTLVLGAAGFLLGRRLYLARRLAQQ